MKFELVKYSVTNYAKYMGISRSAVYRRLKKGDIDRVYTDGKPFIMVKIEVPEKVDNV